MTQQHSRTSSQTPLADFPSCLCAMPHAGAPWNPRRAFLLAATAAAATPALAQVDVGNASALRNLVPAETLENAATQQYDQLLAQAKAQRALGGDDNPQVVRLRGIAKRLIPYTYPWNERARGWRWEVNLIGSKQINAFCMPGGKIAFYTGILDQLKLTDDEIAMIMGHEMAHALREHSRARLAKTQATNIGISLGASLLGLGDMGRAAANLGGQLLTLKFSRSDETDADLVGLELAARAGFNPQASITLWEKMGKATGQQGLQFLSTHPSGPNRIKELQENVSRVDGLYKAALRERK